MVRQIPEETYLSILAALWNIQQIVQPNDQQAAKQNRVQREPDKYAQYNHAYADGPDHLQNKDVIQWIKRPGKGHYEQFYQNQPAAPFYQKNA